MERKVCGEILRMNCASYYQSGTAKVPYKRTYTMLNLSIRYLSLLILPVVFMLSSCNVKRSTETPITNKAWTLVWNDEFDYEGLPDSSKWINEVGFVRGYELQWYTKNQLKNGRVEKGNLILEAHK